MLNLVPEIIFKSIFHHTINQRLLLLLVELISLEIIYFVAARTFVNYMCFFLVI
jgi:hypothetical protein